MRIVPNQVFLDGRERFEPGRIYKVSAPRGSYFIGNKWARTAEKKEYRWYRRIRKHG